MAVLDGKGLPDDAKQLSAALEAFGIKYKSELSSYANSCIVKVNKILEVD